MVNKFLVRKIGVIPTILISIYLENQFYFEKTHEENEGWFFLSHKKIKEELQLKEFTISAAKKTLISLDLLKIERRGIPSKEWLSVNYDNLLNLLLEKKGQDPSKMQGQDPSKKYSGQVLKKTQVLQHEKTRGHINTNISKTINDKIKRTRKDTTKYEMDFIEPKFKESFTRWIQYKKEEKKFQYKNKSSALLAYNKLKEYSNNNPATANEIVTRSIIAGYTGFFPLSNNNTPNKNSTQIKIGYKNIEPLKYKTPIKA